MIKPHESEKFKKIGQFDKNVAYQEMMSSNVTVLATLANIREGVNTTNTICICKLQLSKLSRSNENE